MTYLKFKFQVIKTSTVIIGGAVAFILYGLFRKGKALGNLYFYPKSLKGIKFEGVTPIMTLGLAVQNTSNQGFTMHSMAGELYANNYLIGNISQFDSYQVQPNSETVIDIKVRLSLIGIVTDIINSIKNKTFTHTLELDSTANIDNLQVPVDLKYKFGK